MEFTHFTNYSRNYFQFLLRSYKKEEKQKCDEMYSAFKIIWTNIEACICLFM